VGKFKKHTRHIITSGALDAYVRENQKQMRVKKNLERMARVSANLPILVTNARSLGCEFNLTPRDWEDISKYAQETRKAEIGGKYNNDEPFALDRAPRTPLEIVQGALTRAGYPDLGEDLVAAVLPPEATATRSEKTIQKMREADRQRGRNKDEYRV